jgi:hypothetical protein
MENRLVLVDDLSKSLVEFAGINVFGTVLEVAEESASFREGCAGALCCTKFLLNPLSPAPEPGVVFPRSVMLIETLRDLNQPATITCDRVGFHGLNLGMGNSMGKTVFWGGPKKSVLQSKKGS